MAAESNADPGDASLLKGDEQVITDARSGEEGEAQKGKISHALDP